MLWANGQMVHMRPSWKSRKEQRVSRVIAGDFAAIETTQCWSCWLGFRAMNWGSIWCGDTKWGGGSKMERSLPAAHSKGHFDQASWKDLVPGNS